MINILYLQMKNDDIWYAQLGEQMGVARLPCRT